VETEAGTNVSVLVEVAHECHARLRSLVDVPSMFTRFLLWIRRVLEVARDRVQIAGECEDAAVPPLNHRL
jgi:hypothetical protein